MKDQERMKIIKKQEMRNLEIGRMISEGGLGADYYYDIMKESSMKEYDDAEQDLNKRSNDRVSEPH